MANETNPYAVKFSHQIEDMLLPNGHLFHSCSINGKKCDANNFTSFVNPLFTKCYTFNSAKNGKPVLNASFAGQLTGLKLRQHRTRELYTKFDLAFCWDYYSYSRPKQLSHCGRFWNCCSTRDVYDLCHTKEKRKCWKYFQKQLPTHLGYFVAYS